MKLDVHYERHPAFAPFIKRGQDKSQFNYLFQEMDKAVDAHVAGRIRAGSGWVNLRKGFTQTYSRRLVYRARS